MQNPFLELLKISLSNASELSSLPSSNEWKNIYDESQKQAITGVMTDGLEQLPVEQRPSQDILLQWIGVTQMIEARNWLMNERCKELQGMFASAGFKSCILKGQGNALMYPNPLRRQSGDIDIWVASARDVVIAYLRKYGEIGHIDVKHCDWKVFEDVEVEVHFIPTWFYNPFVNKRLQRWLKPQQRTQFENSVDVGFCIPTISFNLVYVLIHIYRHLFDEGVGLRQLVDYYYVLKHSTVEEREDALKILSTFRIKRFASAVMWVMQDVLGMDEECLLCKPCEKEGQFLLGEVMKAGNFGHYDERNKHYESRWANGWQNLKRNLRFIIHYPQEVCWMPTWKVWHWGWRKWRGYL